MASPSRRLPTNVPGSWFVDRSCIDCGACRWIAPEVFDEAGDASRVHTQPADPAATDRALAALVSCPTASIGTTGPEDVAAAASSFPRTIEDEVLHCGFHSERSFGAASWLIRHPDGNVLVDSPRFAKPLVRRLEALGGVRWMFLTHRDDVADHARFAAHFGCTRILHRRDVSAGTREVEVQLEGEDEHRLAHDLRIVPTPGHTAGSAVLLFRDRFLFTGDSLAWSPRLGQLYAFRDACWYDWATLRRSIARLADLDFAWVLPGHGAPVRLTEPSRKAITRCVEWMGGGFPLPAGVAPG